jgi:uncharacterized protein
VLKNELKNKLISFFRNKPVLKAYLFGSEARDETQDGSDIDILVELDYSNPIGLEFVRMQLELEGILNRKVDLISTGALSKYIRPHIDKEKILIYEK